MSNSCTFGFLPILSKISYLKHTADGSYSINDSYYYSLSSPSTWNTVSIQWMREGMSWWISVWMHNSTSNVKSSKSFQMLCFQALRLGRHNVIYYSFLRVPYSTLTWNISAHVSFTWYSKTLPQKKAGKDEKGAWVSGKRRPSSEIPPYLTSLLFGLAGYFVLMPFDVNSHISPVSGISKPTAPAVHRSSLD